MESIAISYNNLDLADIDDMGLYIITGTKNLVAGSRASGQYVYKTLIQAKEFLS